MDLAKFDRFLSLLRAGLTSAGLDEVWPCFIVGKVGTDLHTSTFDETVSLALFDRVAPLGSLIKGHYTDWVANPAAYPATGMGGANVGPEFTATELQALRELATYEKHLLHDKPSERASNIEAILAAAVVASGRWKKWLLPEEQPGSWESLTANRRSWLVASGARYVWTDPRVLEAREVLYDNVRSEIPEPHTAVVEKIVSNIGKYVEAFNLKDSLRFLVAD